MSAGSKIAAILGVADKGYRILQPWHEQDVPQFPHCKYSGPASSGRMKARAEGRGKPDAMSESITLLFAEGAPSPCRDARTDRVNAARARVCRWSDCETVTAPEPARATLKDGGDALARRF